MLQMNPSTSVEVIRGYTNPRAGRVQAHDAVSIPSRESALLRLAAYPVLYFQVNSS